MSGHLDIGCQESLTQLLRPELRGAIEPWMRQVGACEKRGVVRLARMADGKMLSGFEKPRKKGHAPACAVPKSVETASGA